MLGFPLLTYFEGRKALVKGKPVALCEKDFVSTKAEDDTYLNEARRPFKAGSEESLHEEALTANAG